MGEKRWFLCKLRVTVSSDLLRWLWDKKSKLLSARGDGSMTVMMFMSLSEQEYVNWLKTMIELAELPNTLDRR